MFQLEGKDYDSGQFFQMNGLLRYLGDLSQAHNDLRDLVSKLQLQLENKDKRIKELEGKIQQNAISTDKRCKGIEITINNISKALAGIKGENIRIKEIQVPKELKPNGDLPSSRTESKMGTISKEDELSPQKNNEKENEPSKEEVKEDNKTQEEIKAEAPKEEENITELKNEEESKEEVKEEKPSEDNKEEEKNKEPEQVKEDSIVEENKEDVVIPITTPKQNPEEEIILAEGAKKNNTTISPEMISILFKKVKDNQTRIEALEKYTDTIVTTSKGLKHLDRNINNRVSNLEKTSKGKIDDSKLFI